MTLEARVYPEVQIGNSAILAFTTPAGDDFNMLMYDGTNQQFCYYDFVTGYICSDSDSINPGSWYHVAVTIDKDNEGILLVDGVIEAEFTTVVAPPKTAFFSIGQECDGPVGPPENPDGCFPTSQHFKGKIDEVRIWNYDREQTDIESNKDSPMRGYHQGMVALWHFDEPDDIYTAYDATIYSNDGIIFGKATPSCPDVDEVPPVILCNAPEILVPPDVPISFTAMAIDNCDVSSVEITDYDCYKYTQKGKLVDKTDGCVVEFADDTITILDSAGVGTIITWTIIATDSSGNTSEEICEIPVVIPGKNKDVISGSNKVVPPGKNKDVPSGSNKVVPPGKNIDVISGSNKVVPPGKNIDVISGSNKVVPPGKNIDVISGSNKVVPPGKNKDVPPGKNK
jgi:hypothetical protein